MFFAGSGRTRIEVRSVWFLLMYASGVLDRIRGEVRERILSGEDDNDLLDALALLLANEASDRMRRMLAKGYRQRREVVTRVRGRIDHLGTARGRLMDAGRIQCTYSEQTVDLPRYRHILVTLRHAAVVARDGNVRSFCLETAQMLEREGVVPQDPTRAQMSREQYGHFDIGDRDLVGLSELVRLMSAPEHEEGEASLPKLMHDEHAFRDLFERAVKGFYEMHLGPSGYRFGTRRERWPAQGNAEDLAFLPSLNVDVVMRSSTRQVIVECKFGRVFDAGYHGGPKLKAGYVRQLHSYCTVFSRGVLQPTEGLLLAALADGSPGRDLTFVLDGFPVRVREIDLSRPPSEVRAALLAAVQ